MGAGALTGEKTMADLTKVSHTSTAAMRALDDAIALTEGELARMQEARKALYLVLNPPRPAVPPALHGDTLREAMRRATDDASNTGHAEG